LRSEFAPPSRLLRAATLLVATALAAPSTAAEAPAPQADEPLLEQPVQRREIVVPAFEAEDFEVSAGLGMLAVEDFGSEPLLALRLAYQVTGEIFVEAGAGVSQVADSSFRRIGLPLFPNEEEPLVYYQLSVGYKLLPAELFPAPRRAWIGDLYLIGGVGSVEFADEEEFAFSAGIGWRLLPWRRVSLRVEMRDLMFESDLLGENELKHNLELTAGVGFYF